MKLHATLQFKTTPEHKYHKNDKPLVFEDTYTFYEDRDIDDCKQVIKEDMIAINTYDGPIEIIELTIKEVN